MSIPFQNLGSPNGVLLFHHGRSGGEACDENDYSFRQRQFSRVQPYKTYANPEFRKKIIRISKSPYLTHVTIKELRSAQQNAKMSQF